MAGKMNDDAGAAKDAGLAKLHDGPAQQRFRDHGPDGSVNTRFIEPKQLRMLAVMSVEHLDDLLAQSVPMTGIQDDPGVPVMADLDRTDRHQRVAFRRRQVTGLREGIEVETARRCREHAGERRRGVGGAERIKSRQAQPPPYPPPLAGEGREGVCRRQRIKDLAAAKGALRRLIAQDELLQGPSRNGPVEVKRRNRGFAWLDRLGREECDAAGQILGADMQMGRGPMAERPLAPEQAQLDFDASGRLVRTRDDPDAAPQIIKCDPGQMDGAAIARLDRRDVAVMDAQPAQTRATPACTEPVTTTPTPCTMNARSTARRNRPAGRGAAWACAKAAMRSRSVAMPSCVWTEVRKTSSTAIRV